MTKLFFVCEECEKYTEQCGRTDPTELRISPLGLWTCEDCWDSGDEWETARHIDANMLYVALIDAFPALNEDPSGQRREPMVPDSMDDEPPFPRKRCRCGYEDGKCDYPGCPPQRILP